jgi:hypothetical protein
MVERGSRFLKMEGRPRDGIPLGLGFFLCSPRSFFRPLASPPVFHCSVVFIGKVWLGQNHNGPSTFSFLFFSFFFFFVNFDIFCTFLKRAISKSTQQEKSVIVKLTR